MNPKENITQSRKSENQLQKGRKKKSIIPNAHLAIVLIIIKDQLRLLLFLQSSNFKILHY